MPVLQRFGISRLASVLNALDIGFKRLPEAACKRPPHPRVEFQDLRHAVLQLVVKAADALKLQSREDFAKDGLEFQAIATDDSGSLGNSSFDDQVLLELIDHRHGVANASAVEDDV